MTFSALLWIWFALIEAGPVQRATWSETQHQPLLAGHGGARRSPTFLHLPVFHHAPQPVVAPQLFRPLAYKRTLPAGLTALLLPPTRQPESVQETSARAVDVWCGVDTVSVRVDRMRLRAWTVPSLFRLGSCQPSKISLRFLYFHYGLLECDGESKVVGGQLVYIHSLTYTPPPQDYVLRALPLNFPIHCQYNRFHYSYQVGFIPQLQHTTFKKTLKTKLSYSLTVCNDQWEPLPMGHSFFLGEQVYFLAQSVALLAGERLYVDACYATSSRAQDDSPRLEIISNLGCMTDSRREGSSSQFLSREASVVKFSVDAFLFKAVSQMLYLHCSMAVGLATSVNSKSCNYNKATGRWEELEAQTAVCSCCDSVCADTHHSVEHIVSSPGWFIGQKSEETLMIENVSFQAEEAGNWMREEEKSDDKLGKNLKVQTSQVKTEVSHLEKKHEMIPEVTSLPAKKNKLKENDTEELVVQPAHSPVAELVSDGNIMSDQSRQQDKEEVFRAKYDSVSGLSSSNSSFIPPQVTAYKRISSSGFDPRGVNEKVSSAADPIGPCTFGDKRRCSVTRDSIKAASVSTHAAHRAMSTVTSEGFAAYSAGEQSVNESQFDEILETAILTHPVTRNLEVHLPGFNHVRKLGKRKRKSHKLRLEQLKPVNEPVKTTSSSKGTDGDEDMLHGLQIRESESEQSVHPTGLRASSCIDGLICESDFDSGTEEHKALHLSQFTGAVKTYREMQNLTIPKRCSACSGSASAEYQDGTSHSTGAAASTQQTSTSYQMAANERTETMPHWFIRKQQPESFDRWWWRIYHKHRLVYAGAQ